MSGLVCRATRLAEPPDLLSLSVPEEGFLFEHRGAGVAAWGAALRIPIPPGPAQVARAAGRVAAALAEIRAEGQLGPIAVGALPFDGTWPAALTVPRVTMVRRPDGTAWRVVTGPEDAGEPELEPSRARSPTRRRLRITPVPTPAAYVEAVATARKRIAEGDLAKVVLARMLVARAEEPFDRGALLTRLRAREPLAYLFAASGLVGASPELLVSRRGLQVRASAVAGTMPTAGRAADARAAARLLGSAKERVEHAVVVDAVRAALKGICVPLHVAEPSVLPMRTVLHLATDVHGVLRRPGLGALDLAARLHPTPAVCGTPTDVAMGLIRELEPIDRALYAGMVGWTDARGDGEWAVALRCAEVQGRIALLFAGAGIVADSDPEAELAETDAKLSSMLDALGCA